ncbi:MAG TPA: FAD-dependent oxidoreductase, partial [Aquabacterium sp.]|nr:FAD-dependent oxidoreductase [Aquabacterium sp.]
MHRVAIIGSGISGLSAAWHLAQSEQPVQLTLFEAGHH